MQKTSRKRIFRSILIGILVIVGLKAFPQNDHSNGNESHKDLIKKANELLQDHRYEDALAAYHKLQAQDAANENLSRMIDSVNQLINNRKAFQEIMTKAAEHHRNNEYQKAKDLYEKAIKLDPEAEFPKYKLEQIRAVYTDPEELAAYNQAIERADNYFDTGKFEKAIKAYSTAAEIMPDKDYASEMIAKSEVRLNEYQQIKAQYDSLIAQADSFYNKEDLQNAKALYQQALDLRIENTLPEQRINTIDSITAARKATEDAYRQALQHADSLYIDARFAEAKTAYQEALEIKPEERYPKNMLSRIDEKIVEMKDRVRKYEEAIDQADELYAAGNLKDALIIYKKASNLKPSEQYPKDKIATINKTLDEIAARENQYDEYVSKGDKAYNGGEYSEAKDFYSKALDLKPGKPHPKEQLAVVDSILTARKLKTENYEEAVAQADKLLEEKAYEEAKTNYQAALQVKPDASYPQQKITEIEKIQQELAEKKQQYNDLITEADRLFEAGSYEQAKERYRSAVDVLPEKNYPSKQVSAIDSIYQARKEQQANFEEALAQADEFYRKENYIDARKEYEKALEYKPGHQHAQQRFNEVDAIIKERQKAIQNAYDKAIANADRFYQMRVYDKAIEAFKEAQEIKPEEDYPQTMISRIKEYLDSHSVLELVEQPLEIQGATEKKLTFDPLAPNMRDNNYLRIKMKKTSGSNPKLFINYGKGNRKNGGIVLKNIDNTETDDYIINLSGQDPWYRMDNDWISIYPEGGNIEISLIQISTSE